MITDFNNPKMHTTADIRYNRWFGFTDDENLEGGAKKALKQIEDKKYDNYLGRRKPEKIVHYGIAFCLKDCRILKGGEYMCDKKPIDVSELSETQLNGELEKGYQDIQEKRVKAAANVFAEMHINYKF